MTARVQATIDDVLELASQGKRYELIDGELSPMSPTGSEHGDIEGYVAWLFNSHVLPRRLGKVLVGEVLFKLDPAERVVRAPDMAFVSRERWKAQSDHASPFVGAPDLAVEIISPTDSASDIQRKVDDWLAHGTAAVLVMYPAWRSVVLWRANETISLRDDDELELAPELPGFRCKVSELFPPSLEEAEGATSSR